MAIPPNTFIPIPRGLYIVMWLEFLLFVPFSISHYAGAFKSVWAVFAPNPLGKATFWQGEMLNGVGAWVLMYMLGSALWDGTISACEVEILFLSHALWYGVVFATEAPGPAFAVKAQANPHTWLYLGVIFTGYDLPRPICFLLSVGILAFGLYRRWVQFPRECFGKESITLQDFIDAAKQLDESVPERAGMLGFFESSRAKFPMLDAGAATAEKMPLTEQAEA